MLNRRFQIWEYTVSHAQLLLRSVRDDHNSTRVDVLFKNVGYLALPSTLLVAAIEEVRGELHLLPAAAAEAASGVAMTVFRLRSTPDDGIVVAGAVVTAEDELESHEPSGLPCWPMRSGPSI